MTFVYADIAYKFRGFTNVVTVQSNSESEPVSEFHKRVLYRIESITNAGGMVTSILINDRPKDINAE